MEERLICFLWLESRCGSSLHNCLDLLDDGLLEFDVVNDGRVGIERQILLANNLEVELLRRGITHLETLDGRCSLG